MKNSRAIPEISNFETIDKLYSWYLEEENQRPDSKEIQDSIEEYEQITKKMISGDLEMKLWESVCSYGENRERKGFRDGFRLAFKLLQEARI